MSPLGPIVSLDFRAINLVYWKARIGGEAEGAGVSLREKFTTPAKSNLAIFQSSFLDE
jgi:hypothetical protein